MWLLYQFHAHKDGVFVTFWTTEGDTVRKSIVKTTLRECIIVNDSTNLVVKKSKST